MAISTNLIKSFQLSALTTALALAGCGGGGGNDTLPPPSNPGQSNGGTTTPTTNVKDVDSITITKSFDTFILKQDEKFTIIANALKSGKPVEGVIVDATIPDPATSGIYVITPTPITTNANGEAAIELQIKDLAKATAYLKVNSDKLSISVKPTNSKQAITNGTISLTGAAPSISTEITNVINDARSLMLSPSNANFKLEVGTQITVSAFVADSKGGALKNVPVTFDLSNLPSLGIYNLSGSTVNTDDRGIATITLQVMSLDKREDLKNGFQVDAFIDRDIDLKASNRPTFKGVDNLDTNTGSVTAESLVNSIILTPNVDSIPLTTGSTFTLTVTTNDKDNKPIGNAPIAFTYPTLAEYGLTVANSSATTNGSGQAIVTFTVNSLTTAQKAKLIQGFTVNASSNGKFAQASLTAKNETAESLVNSISLTPSVDTISLTPNAQFSVTATTLGKDGKPVSNAPVAFSYPTLADYGLTIASSSPNTNGSGQAVMTFAVNASLTTAQKAKLAEGFTVNASSNAKTATAVTLKSIKVATVADIAKVNLVTDKNTLTTNTGETINVTAQVRDTNNVSLANMPVSFTLLDAAAATGITNTTPLQATTNANGEAVLTLKVGALTPDQKYYLQTSGLSFKATAGAITSSTVTLRTQEAITANSVNTLLLTSDSAIQLAVGSKVKVSALAIDKNGAVVPNAQVSFKVPTDSGLVNNTGAVVNTNANGEATIEVEIKDLAKATTALQNGLVVTAQSGVAVGTTAILSASSQSATQAYNIFVSKSKDELRTGTDSLTMTIRVTDTKGGVQANVPVYLQILEDGIARGLSFNKVSNLKTDDKGLVTVDLSQNDIGLVSRLNGTGKVSVIVNDGIYRAEKEEITIPITGTTVDNLFVSNKEISSTTSSTISATALDGSGKPFANTKVELLLNGKSLATPKFVSTDAQGKFTFTAAQADLGQAANYPLSVRLFGNNAQGVEISSSPIALTELKTISQTETKLEVRANNVLMANNEILVNTTGQITILRPKDKAGNLLVEGSEVYLSTNKGTLNGQGTRVKGIVDKYQQVTFSINSPVANTATLVLEYNGEQIFTDSISFLTKDVANPLILQLERTTLSTNGETNVISIVKDSNGLPVKNAIVEFSLVKDPSGGRLEKGYAITDDSGNATVKYFSGRTPTANDAVEIQANVGKIQINGKEENTNLSIKSDIKKITVQTNATFIGFGFADKIRQHPDGRQIYYVYDGSIFVNNNIGQPAANQPISVSIIPVQYLLGEYYVIPKIPAVSEVKDDPNTAQDESSPAVPEVPAKWGIRHYDDNGNSYSYGVMCTNEDINSNGIMDNITLTDLATGKSLIGEDFNNNGKLDPLNPATILSASGSEVVNGQTMTTDSTGKLDFSIRYTKESADWWLGMIKVTTKVNGTEFVEYRTISLPTAVEDVSQPDATPPLRPNWISPFGKRTVLSVPTNYLYIGMGKGNYAVRNLKYVNVGVGNGEYIVDTSNHYPITINNKPYCQ